MQAAATAAEQVKHDHPDVKENELYVYLPPSPHKKTLSCQ